MGRLFGPKITPPAEVPPPAPTPAPEAKFGREEVETLLTGALKGVGDQVTGVMAQLTERIDALASRQPQVIVQGQANAPVVHGISDEELDSAVLSGQGAAGRIRALVDQAVTRETSRLLKEHIEPLQAFGVNALGNQAVEIATGKMPFYTKFKKEIDQRVAGLPPQAKADPVVLKLVHDAIVGEHAVDLQREAAEEALRKASEPLPDPAAPVRHRGSAVAGSGAGHGASRDEGDIPSPADLGGGEASAALAHKGANGQDQDAFARGMGYGSWNEYIRQYDELVKAETQGRA